MPVLDAHVAFESTHHGVVGEQVAKRLVVEEVVDGDDLDVPQRFRDAEDRAADAAEAVDGDSHQEASFAVASSRSA